MDVTLMELYNDSSEQKKVSFGERKGLQVFESSSPNELVKTISKDWLSLNELKDEAKFNPLYVKNIDKLSKNYSG